MFKNKNAFITKQNKPQKESVKRKAINGYENIREKLDSTHNETTTPDNDKKKKVSIGI